MKIFTGYILREFLGVFLVSILILIGIFVINDASEFIASLLVKGACAKDIIKVFVLGIPSSFMLVIPISFVMGWVVTVSRFAGDLEILALQSSGVNPRRLLKITAVCGLLVSVFLFYSNSTLSPKSNLKMENEIRRLLSKNILKLRQKNFTRFGNYIFFADKVKNNDMYGVRIYKIEKTFPSVKIFAASGSILNNADSVTGMELENGRMFITDPGEESVFTSVTFKKYTFTLNSASAGKHSRRIVQMTSAALKKKIADFKSRALPATALDVEYNLRIAMAFCPFFLALAGAALGLRVKSPRKAVGIGVAVLLMICYYLIFMVGIHTAQTGWLPSWLAVWIPNALCAGVALSVG